MSEFDSTTSNRLWDGLIELQPQQLVQIAFIGVITGVVAWLPSLLLGQVIMVPLWCENPSNSACASAPGVASMIASILAAFVGLMGLVRMSVYRPLLIVLATTISVWGLGDWLAATPWYETLGWYVVLYGFSFAAFAWLVRPRAFAPALVSVIVVVLLARLATL